MAETKLTFKRYEKKYLLSAEQFELFWQQIEPYIEPDEYFSSTVCSIYYDDGDFSLIRHSLDKPVYKEKLRLRSYNVPESDGEVFVELKKKFKGIVYKRRVRMTARQAEDYLAGHIPAPEDSQIFREIDWFMDFYKPVPKAFIACEREAYHAKSDHDLRVTFDRNLRWRNTELEICAGAHGEPLTEPGQVLLELKIPDAAPLWLCNILSDTSVFPVSFSKYGTYYKNHILEKYINGVNTSV